MDEGSTPSGSTTISKVMEFKTIKKSLNNNVLTLVDQIGNTIKVDPRNEEELIVESRCEYVRITRNKDNKILTLSFPFGPYFYRGKKPGIVLNRIVVTDIVEVKCPVQRQGCIYKHMYKIKINKCHVKWSL